MDTIEVEVNLNDESELPFLAGVNLSHKVLGGSQRQRVYGEARPYISPPRPRVADPGSQHVTKTHESLATLLSAYHYHLCSVEKATAEGLPSREQRKELDRISPHPKTRKIDEDRKTLSLQTFFLFVKWSNINVAWDEILTCLRRSVPLFPSAASSSEASPLDTRCQFELSEVEFGRAFADMINLHLLREDDVKSHQSHRTAKTQRQHTPVAETKTAEPSGGFLTSPSTPKHRGTAQASEGHASRGVPPSRNTPSRTLSPTPSRYNRTLIVSPTRSNLSNDFFAATPRGNVMDSTPPGPKLNASIPFMHLERVVTFLRDNEDCLLQFDSTILRGYIQDYSLACCVLTLPVLEIFVAYKSQLYRLFATLQSASCCHLDSVAVMLVHLCSGVALPTMDTNLLPRVASLLRPIDYNSRRKGHQHQPQGAEEGVAGSPLSVLAAVQRNPSPSLFMSYRPSQQTMAETTKHVAPLALTFNTFCELVATLALHAASDANTELSYAQMARNQVLSLLTAAVGGTYAPEDMIESRIRSALSKVLSEQTLHLETLSLRFEIRLKRVYLYYCCAGDLQGVGLMTLKKFRRFLQDLNVAVETPQEKLYCEEIFMSLYQRRCELDPKRYSPSALPSTGLKTKALVETTFQLSFVLFAKAVETLAHLHLGYATDAMVRFVATAFGEKIGSVSEQCIFPPPAPAVTNYTPAAAAQPSMVTPSKSRDGSELFSALCSEDDIVRSRDILLAHRSGLLMVYQGYSTCSNNNNAPATSSVPQFGWNELIFLLKGCAEIIPTFVNLSEVGRLCRAAFIAEPAPYERVSTKMPFEVFQLILLHIAYVSHRTLSDSMPNAVHFLLERIGATDVALLQLRLRELGFQSVSAATNTVIRSPAVKRKPSLIGSPGAHPHE